MLTSQLMRPRVTHLVLAGLEQVREPLAVALVPVLLSLENLVGPGCQLHLVLVLLNLLLG